MLDIRNLERKPIRNDIVVDLPECSEDSCVSRRNDGETAENGNQQKQRKDNRAYDSSDSQVDVLVAVSVFAFGVKETHSYTPLFPRPFPSRSWAFLTNQSSTISQS